MERRDFLTWLGLAPVAVVAGSTLTDAKTEAARYVASGMTDAGAKIKLAGKAEIETLGSGTSPDGKLEIRFRLKRVPLIMNGQRYDLTYVPS